MTIKTRFAALLVLLALVVVVSGCSAEEAKTPAAPAEDVQELTLVEPSTPEDEAFLQAFEASDAPPGFPSGWTALSVDDIPEELIPTETLGGDLLGAAIRHTDGASGETTPGAPAYMKLLFEGGILIQGTNDDSARPNAIILADHAQEMATHGEYSRVQTETVAGTLGLVTIGELPPEWWAATWVGGRRGAAVQWADEEWFYNVWISGSEDVDAVLSVARSM